MDETNDVKSELKRNRRIAKSYVLYGLFDNELDKVHMFKMNLN